MLEEGAHSRGDPLVSIVIPTCNSANYLAKCLDSVKSQTYRNIEVVVVDKGSVDGTRQVAESYGVLVLDGRSERTTQCNYGARVSRGEFVYFVGSDFVLDNSLVTEAVHAAIATKSDALTIPNYSDASVSFWARVRHLERSTYIGDSLIEAARFFRREAYLSVGGFDEDMVAYEEHDLHNRIVEAGYRVGSVTTAKELHLGEPTSLLEVARKHYYYGKTIGHYIKKYPGKARRQLSPIRPSYVRNWRVFVKHPFLTCGFVVYQIVRYSSSGAGYLVSRCNSANRRLESPMRLV